MFKILRIGLMFLVLSLATLHAADTGSVDLSFSVVSDVSIDTYQWQVNVSSEWENIVNNYISLLLHS